MNIVCFNANGLVGKAEDILDVIQQKDINISIILETHLGIGSSILHNPIVDLRKELNIGQRQMGGLMIYTDENTRNNINVLWEDKNADFAVIEIGGKVIAAAYLAPSLDNSCVATFVDKATELAANRDLILVGDWNARIGAMANDTHTCARGRILIEQLAEKDLILESPESGLWTCMNCRGQSVVDHLLTNGTDIREYHIMKDSIGGSDHRPLIFKLNVDANAIPRSFCRWDIRKLAEETVANKYRIELEKNEMTVYNEILNGESIDGKWTRLKDWIEDALRNSCGTIKFSNQPNRSFWTETLRRKKRRLVEEISNLEQLTLSRHQAPIINAARSALWNNQKEYRDLLMERRDEVFRNIVQNLNKKQNANVLMRYVRNVKARRARTGCKLDPNLMDRHREHFMTTFGGDPMATEAIPETTHTDYISNRINPADLRTIIKRLSLGTAPGTDGLMPEVYYLGGEAMIRILTLLMNTINEKCNIPSEWKTANVALIYKNKGSDLDARNYRPISLTITARRIYERLVMIELKDATKLLKNSQGGFRKKRSTIHQVYAWAELNWEPKKRGHSVKKTYTNVLLDFQAAYDLVDRRILWSRLKRDFSIQESTIRRLQELFDNNQSVLLIKGRKSEPIPCRRGLLQGSSLSPLLFNFFIDGLLTELKENRNKIRKNGIATNNLAFADDIVLITENKEQMKELLEICEEWSVRVGMRFAPSKCVLISQEEQSGLKLYNQDLPCSNNERYLGININTEGINFTKLAKERTDKAKGVIRTLGNIGMNIGGFSPEASARIYKTFIRPVMEYGMQLAPIEPENLKLYQGAQNLALRKILSAPRTASTNAIHKLLQIEKIATRNNILNIKFCGKLHNSMDGTIPAVRIWRSNIQDRPPGSLTQRSKDKNPLWEKASWANHVNSLLGNNRNQPDALPPQKAKKIIRESLLELDHGASNVAGRIEMDKIEKHRFILRENNIDKRRIITLTRWLIGVVAMHQPCKNCPDRVALSRSHAQSCSGALNLLQRHFEIPLFARSTPIDFLLNKHRHSPETATYNHISESIALIYTKCLGFVQSDKGFWNLPNNGDNAQDTVH